MKVVITGAAGYIGSVLIDELIRANQSFLFNIIDEFVAVDNLMYKQTSLAEYCHRDNFTFIKADVRDYGAYEEHIKTADVIIPLACIVGMPACKKYPELTTETNEEAIKWLTKVTSKDQLIIYPTTNSGYGIGQDGIYCTEETPLKPISLYGHTKVNAEDALLNYGNAVTLRLATVFGISPRMRLDLLVNDFTYKAFKEKYIVLFESHFKRNYIHIRDVVKTMIFAIQNRDKMIGEPFNVGLSEANLSKMELCKKIQEYVPDFFITESEINQDPDKRNYIVSNEKLEALGWKPQHSLDSGIKELLKAYPIIENSNNLFTNL